MTLRLELSKVDGGEAPVATFTKGTHVIGRGDALQCPDKRVSRSHASISVSDIEATLTSIHVNPCFFKAFDGSIVRIITKDKSIPLSDGDKFAFLADLFWFKVRLIKEDDVANNNLPEVSNNKRGISESGGTESDPEEKKPRLETEDLATSSTNETIDNPIDAERAFANAPTQPPDVKPEPEATEVKTESSSQKPGTSHKDQNKDKGDKQSDDSKPGTSSKQRRDRCWYADKCYRKNPTHRTNFSHPTDPDYDSDPNDDRPLCRYGTNCYRRNFEHRRDHKHPPVVAKAKRTRGVATSYNISDDEEEDPYADDGGSDASYTPGNESPDEEEYQSEPEED